jgi:hypothetical protein
MRNLDDKIEEIKVKIYELQKDLAVIMNDAAKPKKWSPVGGEYFVCTNGSVYEGHTEKEMRLFGLERPTEAQIERAAIEMRKFNRLLALRDELCGDEVVNWRSNDSKFHIHFHTTDKIWFVGLEFQCQFIMPYFTSQEAAQKACDMLNSGEVEL